MSIERMEALDLLDIFSERAPTELDRGLNPRLNLDSPLGSNYLASMYEIKIPVS